MAALRTAVGSAVILFCAGNAVAARIGTRAGSFAVNGVGSPEMLLGGPSWRNPALPTPALLSPRMNVLALPSPLSRAVPTEGAIAAAQALASPGPVGLVQGAPILDIQVLRNAAEELVKSPGEENQEGILNQVFYGDTVRGGPRESAAAPPPITAGEPFHLELVGPERTAWTAADYLQRAGRKLIFAYENVPTVQEIIPLNAFSAPEKDLVKRLLSLSRNRTYKLQSHAREWRKYFDYYSRHDPSKSGLSRSQIAEQATKMVPVPGAVEVGAWRVGLSDGRVVTGLHTSRKPSSIEGKDFQASLNGALSRKLTSPEDVEKIVFVQYFHTHPSLAPLSPEDVQSLGNFRNGLREGRINAPVHMYAISEADGQVVVFYAGTE